ncbi:MULTISPECIES: hypothetical protein [Pseudomonas]|uniref:hypothetical protein n=1 Tax=Pseudomonas TaxID=286 RepID=UPI0015E397CC|nr:MULTISPECIES: hypothetical protein [Pseudomonas]MBA1288432.1 hypothetical protein [Pseudomonas japonica]
MTLKTTGLELKTFYTDPTLWNGRDGQPLYWIDDIGLVVNDGDVLDNADIPTLADTDHIDILSGFVYAYEHLGEVATLEDYFQMWRNGLGRSAAPDRRYRAAVGLQGSLLGG